MDLAIVQRLVCPQAHARTPLVVRADTAMHGRLQHGVLGCPVCSAEWNVAEGIAAFGPRATIAANAVPDVTTLAALLGLTDAKLLITDGVPAQTVIALAREFAASVVAIDSDVSPESASVIDGASVVPLADGIAEGSALLRSRDERFVASVVRSMAPEARLVATTTLAVPAGVREIARNDELWVAEREPDVVTVPLRRRT